MKSKSIFLSLIFLVMVGNSNSQTFELGIAPNINTFIESDGYNDGGLSGKPKFGLGVYCRYLNTYNSAFLKHLEIGIENYRGGMRFNEHISPGGSGGDNINIDQSRFIFTFSDYFINFGTLNKPFQFSLGININAAFFSRANGYYEVQRYRWDTSSYVRWYDRYYFQKNNSPDFNFLQGGLVAAMAFKSIHIKGWEIKPRYTCYLGITRELHVSLPYSPFRQRFEISIVRPIGSLVKHEALGKKRLKKSEFLKQKRKLKRQEREHYRNSRVKIRYNW